MSFRRFTPGHLALVAPGSTTVAEPGGNSRRKGKQLDRKNPRLQGSEAVGRGLPGARAGSECGGWARTCQPGSCTPSIKGSMGSRRA